MSNTAAGSKKEYTDEDLWVRGLKDQGVQPRKSITKLSPEELYLFVEGLASFQNADESDLLSFHQIAGIHGMPYTAWGKKEWYKNVKLSKSNKGDLNGGFCTHNSILFLTWHRPYLSLFETQLHKHVNNVAKGLPQPYVDAAANFRLPYWDWAELRDQADSVFPQYALSRNNPSKAPSSTTVQSAKSNSLFSTRIPNGFPSIDQEGEVFTVENPPQPLFTFRSSNLEANMKSIYKNYKNFDRNDPRRTTLPGSNLTERVGYILRSYAKYASMSNNKGDPSPSRSKNAESWGGLEDIHNALHGNVGGVMGSIDSAAFDPIFWLHHCNIDRLYAIWQTIHEHPENDSETFVTKRAAGYNNLVHRPNTFEDKDTPLYPFRKETGWYKSDDSRRTADFGYCYLETQKEKSAEVMLAELAKLYPTAADQLRASRSGANDAGIALLGQAHIMQQMVALQEPATAQVKEQLLQEMPSATVLLDQSWQAEKPLLKNILKDNKYQEWLVNIRAERHSLGGKYRVAIFLGPVQEDDVQSWSMSPTFVGTFDPLGRDADTGCANCQQQQADHLLITGQIPLTLALYERYLAQILPNLEVDTVNNYLAENLHWKVELNGQVLQDRSQVAGLTVFVVTNEVTLPEDPAQPPIYAPDVVIHPEATTKQNGGGRGEGTGLTPAEVPAQ